MHVLVVSRVVWQRHRRVRDSARHGGRILQGVLVKLITLHSRFRQANSYLWNIRGRACWWEDGPTKLGSALVGMVLNCAHWDVCITAFGKGCLGRNQRRDTEREAHNLEVKRNHAAKQKLWKTLLESLPPANLPGNVDHVIHVGRVFCGLAHDRYGTRRDLE